MASKLYNNNNNNIIEHENSEKVIELLKEYPIFEMLENYSVLDIKDRKGETDYIDFIKWEEVNGIMYGVDSFNRLFIVMKLIIDGDKILQTFFQRYTYNISSWHACGHATTQLILSTGGMNDIQFELIVDILRNKKAVIRECHRPTCNKYIDKEVSVIE